jgi:argininosuccinate synthase
VTGVQRIVLAYAGDLQDSIAIRWLADTHRAEVATLTLELGQGPPVDDVRQRALAAGAARAHVIDARAELARAFILPALQAGALYEGRYPLSTALGRPLIARHLVELAHIEGATAVAHGCHVGNDQVRIESAVRALDPGLTVIAPAATWTLSRVDQASYARREGLAAPDPANRTYSVDANLWGRSVRYGGLEDAWREPSEDVYALTKSPAESPDLPAYVEIEFDGGVPVAINDVSMPLVELITSLQTIAGAHGVGRIDMVENPVAGSKSREIYEAPAAVALHAAHRDQQTLVTARDLERLAAEVSVRYADLVYNGLWYTPAREALDAFVGKVQERVSGRIRLKLFKGDCRVVGRKSAFSVDQSDTAGRRTIHQRSGQGVYGS